MGLILSETPQGLSGLKSLTILQGTSPSPQLRPKCISESFKEVIIISAVYHGHPKAPSHSPRFRFAFKISSTHSITSVEYLLKSILDFSGGIDFGYSVIFRVSVEYSPHTTYVMNPSFSGGKSGRVCAIYFWLLRCDRKKSAVLHSNQKERCWRDI